MPSSGNTPSKVKFRGGSANNCTSDGAQARWEVLTTVDEHHRALLAKTYPKAVHSLLGFQFCPTPPSPITARYLHPHCPTPAPPAHASRGCGLFLRVNALVAWSKRPSQVESTILGTAYDPAPERNYSESASLSTALHPKVLLQLGVQTQEARDLHSIV